MTIPTPSAQKLFFLLICDFFFQDIILKKITENFLIKNIDYKEEDKKLRGNKGTQEELVKSVVGMEIIQR